MGQFSQFSRRAFLVSAALVLGTSCQQLSPLTRKATLVNDPRQAIDSYFKLVTASRYDDAESLLSSSYQQQLGASGVQSLLHAFSTVQVTDMTDAVAWANSLGAQLPAPPSDRREYLVTLHVDPTASGASTWANGVNRRFVDVIRQGGGWQIDSIGTSPGVLITGLPKAQSETSMATLVIPVEPLHLGPTPVDRVIYTARQNSADRGQLAWATDPLEVIHRDGESFGINSSDPAVITVRDEDPTSLMPRLNMRVQHGDQQLVVTLVQPIRTGPGGVWAISSIELAPV